MVAMQAQKRGGSLHEHAGSSLAPRGTSGEGSRGEGIRPKENSPPLPVPSPPAAREERESLESALSKIAIQGPNAGSRLKSVGALHEQVPLDQHSLIWPIDHSWK